jgi:hypothetical protein
MYKICYYFNNHVFDNLDNFKEYIETNTVKKDPYYSFRFYNTSSNSITLTLQSYDKIFAYILNNYTYMELIEGSDNINELTNKINNLEIKNYYKL